jgi:WD40 repeat protein
MTKKGLTTAGLLALLGTALGCGDLDNFNVAVNVRYAPDGTLVVFAGDAIDLFDSDLSTPTGSIPTSPGIFSLSDDGKVAAVASAGGGESRIAIFDVRARQEVSSVDLGPSPADFAEDLALSPQGDLVYVMGPVGSVGTTNLMNGGADSGGVAMFDTSTGAQLWAGDWAIMPTFSPDGKTVYVSGNRGLDLQGFDARSGVQGLDAPQSSNVVGFGTMPDVNTLIALVEPGCVPTPDLPCSLSIEFLSVADGSVLRQYPLVANTVLSGDGPLGLPAFRCSTAAGLCAVNLGQIDPSSDLVSSGGQVQVWTTGGAMRQAIFTGASDLAISPDGQFLAIASRGDAQVYRISDGLLVNSHHYTGTIF